jgi:glycine betaine/proline transport system permease protein
MMMVLATVIIASLIGAGGLGLLAYQAAVKAQTKLGLGTAGGLSIVLLAIMLDRLTQAWGTSKETEQRA